MPWNEPGKNNEHQDPWGGGKKDKGPPDLDKVIADLVKKMSQFFSGKKTISWPPTPTGGAPSAHYYGIVIGVLAVAALGLWFISGLFIANPAEQAVVLRFGKYSEVLQPGLHWIARFVDTKYLVDIQKIHSFSLQGDFLTKSTEQGDLPNQYINLPKKVTPTTSEGADKSKNLVSVELSVQYRVNDPRAYLFGVVNPDQTIEQVASGALSDVVGQMKLDEVLTIGRESLSSGVADRIKQILKSYGSGLEVVAVTLRKVQAPDQVRIAFNDVNRADQDRSTYIQHAQAYASRVVPLAQGNAARIQADANGYRQQVVLTAQADIARYQALMKVYQHSPEVTRERMYLETIEKVLSSTSKILVEGGNGNNVMYLPLDQLLNSAKNITKLTAVPSTQALTNTDQQNGTGVQQNDNH